MSIRYASGFPEWFCEPDEIQNIHLNCKTSSFVLNLIKNLWKLQIKSVNFNVSREKHWLIFYFFWGNLKTTTLILKNFIIQKPNKKLFLVASLKKRFFQLIPRSEDGSMIVDLILKVSIFNRVLFDDENRRWMRNSEFFSEFLAEFFRFSRQKIGGRIFVLRHELKIVAHFEWNSR